MDDIIEKLEISKGSASQGLSTLKGLGAIVPISVKDDRREHYRADLQVSRIINHFIEDRLQPRFENGEARLERMIDLVSREDCNSDNNETARRIEALLKWQGRGKKAIPFVKSILKSEN